MGVCGPYAVPGTTSVTAELSAPASRALMFPL